MSSVQKPLSSLTLQYGLIDRDARLVDDGSYIMVSHIVIFTIYMRYHYSLLYDGFSYKYWIMVSHIITNQRGLAATAWTSTRSVGNQPRPPLPTQPSSCRWQGPRPRIHKSRKTSSEDIIRRHHRKTFGCVWKWMQPAIMRIVFKHIYDINGVYIYIIIVIIIIVIIIVIVIIIIFLLLLFYYYYYYISDISSISSISYIIYKQLTIWSIWDCLKMRGTLTLNSWQV
jgi:hypothetical protein